MIENLFGGKFLDDVDPEQLTDEQKQALKHLFETDPYGFYNLWRDPDAAQRRFEGDDFQTTPASENFLQMGALYVAGAPDSVLNYWQQQLETHNRPNAEKFPIPPKQRPIAEKLQQIDDFCTNLNVEFNRTDDYAHHPENDFVPEEHPLSGKWQAVMMSAKGEPLVVRHCDGSARHYKATDPVLAASGVEIVEITITAPAVSIDLDAYKVSDDLFDEVLPDHVHPYSMKVIRDPDAIRIYLQYQDIYE